MGFQVAYFLQNREAVASYESCSTSAFKHGRTETLRPATLETLAFSKLIEAQGSSTKSNAELKKALYDCSAMHGKLTKEAAMGRLYWTLDKDAGLTYKLGRTISCMDSIYYSLGKTISCMNSIYFRKDY